MSEKRKKRVSRAVKTNELLENPAFKEALQWLRKNALAKFHEAKTPGVTWEAKMEYETVERFAAQLLTYVRSGESAAEELRRENEAELEKQRKAHEDSSWLERATKAREEWDAAHSMTTTPSTPAPEGAVSVGA